MPEDDMFLCADCQNEDYYVCHDCGLCAECCDCADITNIVNRKCPKCGGTLNLTDEESLGSFISGNTSFAVVDLRFECNSCWFITIINENEPMADDE